MIAVHDLDQANARGELAGYRCGPPPGGSGAEIDIEVCRDSRCDACGHVGLTCRQFHSRRGYSYRAFAICPSCQNQEEI